MKKRFCTVLITLMILFCCAGPALADGPQPSPRYEISTWLGQLVTVLAGSLGVDVSIIAPAAAVKHSGDQGGGALPTNPRDDDNTKMAFGLEPSG